MKKMHFILFSYLALLIQPAFSSSIDIEQKDVEEVAQAFHAVGLENTKLVDSSFKREFDSKEMLDLSRVKIAFAPQGSKTVITGKEMSSIKIGDCNFGGKANNGAVSADCLKGNQDWLVTEKKLLGFSNGDCVLCPKMVLSLESFPFDKKNKSTIQTYRNNEQKTAYLNLLKMAALEHLFLNGNSSRTTEDFLKLWSLYNAAEAKRKFIHVVSTALAYFGEKLGYESSKDRSGNRSKGAFKTLQTIAKDENSLSLLKTALLKADTKSVSDESNYQPATKANFCCSMWRLILRSKAHSNVFDSFEAKINQNIMTVDTEYDQINNFLKALYPGSNMAYVYFSKAISKGSSFYEVNGTDTEFTFNFNGLFALENSPFKELMQAK